MDIRDFKEEPLEVGNLKLEEIYSLQKALVDKYRLIEKLPDYPLDVNTKSSQVILKDFVGRVIEELAEGYESQLEVKNLTYNNNMWLHAGSMEDCRMMINYLQNLNEEQADAMHFMVELLIYANIQPDDIKRYLMNKWLITARGFSVKDENNILEFAMDAGYHEVISDFNHDEDNSRVIDLSQFLTDEQIKYIPAGRELLVGEFNTIEVSDKFLWYVTYSLNIARNCLKNKPWKQTGVMTNESLFQIKLVEGFLYMCGYFKFIGMSPSDIYYLYFKKNLANQFRIKSKY